MASVWWVPQGVTTKCVGMWRRQHLNQRSMIPRSSTDEFLHDESLDIDEGGDVLGILAGQVRQQPLEIEVHVALSGLGL